MCVQVQNMCEAHVPLEELIALRCVLAGDRTRDKWHMSRFIYRSGAGKSVDQKCRIAVAQDPVLQ